MTARVAGLRGARNVQHYSGRMPKPQAATAALGDGTLTNYVATVIQVPSATGYESLYRVSLTTPDDAESRTGTTEFAAFAAAWFALFAEWPTEDTPDGGTPTNSFVSWPDMVAYVAAEGGGGGGGAPSGAAGGSLSGTYPNPGLADSAVTTGKIAASAVTLGKMEDRAQATVLGRKSGAGTGAPQEMSPSETRTVLGLATVATSGAMIDLTGSVLASPRLPTVIPPKGVPSSNVTLNLGRAFFVPLPVFAIPVKVTNLWVILTATGAGSTGTAALHANAAGGDLPGAQLATTSVGAINLSSATGTTGAALTAAYTIPAFTQVWAAFLALNGSAATARGIGGSGIGFTAGPWSAAPVAPVDQSTWPCGFIINSQTAIPNPPSLASTGASTSGPAIWCSIEAP